MTWLERLKALRQEADGLPRHRQNRQNPGFVSFDSPEVAQIPSGENAEPEVEREAFEERAAIMEYDGGLSRVEAERRAAEMHPLPVIEPQQIQWRGEGMDLGDLRPCLWCRNLARSGRCLSAWRGELRAARDYSPTKPDLPRRCIGYSPPGHDPDQRPGRERWPELADWQAPLICSERST